MRFGIIAAVLVVGCASRQPSAVLPGGAEAISLLGDTLRSPALADATRALYESRLDSARRAVQANASDPEALIWLGRRTAYLGRYREAIAIFSDGIARWPGDARFYRHRGHRYITIRRFADAARDFERAERLVRGRVDEVEPDGLPNARNIPTSTLQFNIYYHQALAHYLRGEWSRAHDAWQRCLGVSLNHDAQVATRYWLYLSLRRMGRQRDAEAILGPVLAELDIVENRAYHRLLLAFKGELPVDALFTPDDAVDTATVAYGIAAWHGAEGRREENLRWLRRARSGSQWAAFGYIAAEADLARSQR